MPVTIYFIYLKLLYLFYNLSTHLRIKSLKINEYLLPECR